MKKLFAQVTSLMAAAALVLVCVMGSVAVADEPTVSAETRVEEKVDATQLEQTDEKRQQVIEEATAAIRETQDALAALDKDNMEGALASLERAIGKLELILAREPELALAPADVTAVTNDVIASVEAIEAIRDRAEEALEDGRLQDARHMLDGLASEIIIRVTSLPLATYPDAIKLAVGMIDEGEVDEAKRVLNNTLSTLVVNDTIIPLPVVIAEGFLDRAQILAEKENRSEEESAELGDLLKAARKELKLAQALGYGGKEHFEKMYTQLDEIKQKTKDGKFGTGFFSRIRGTLKETVESSQPEESLATG